MLAIHVEADYDTSIGTSMSTPLILSILAALTAIGLLSALAAYCRERSGAHLDADPTSDSSASDRESFSEYYRPMARVLDARELAAARELCGNNHGEFARFRSGRIVSFRSYLNDMRLDFNRVDFKMRYLLLSASAEDADLVQQLNGLKFSFQIQVWRVEFQLLAFRLGLGAVDTAPLIEMLEQFEASLTRRPTASAAAA